MLLSAAPHASTGSSTPCTSTASPADSPPPESAPAVSTRATATARRVLAAGKPGSDTTPFPFGVFVLCFCVCVFVFVGLVVLLAGGNTEDGILGLGLALQHPGTIIDSWGVYDSTSALSQNGSGGVFCLFSRRPRS